MRCKLLMGWVIGWTVAAAGAQPVCPVVAPDSPVRVDAKVRVKGAPDAAVRPEVTLRQTLTLCVAGLDRLLKEQAASTTGSHIVLFLDDRAVPDLTPDPIQDPRSGALSFTLLRKAKALETWKLFLGRPTFEPKVVAVSVGIEDRFAQPSDARIALSTIPFGWFWTWAVLVGLLVAGFAALAMRSNLLRDLGTEPVQGRRPFSLAKTQAMWWFFLVLASFLFIGLITGDYGTAISNTALALIGISAATTLGGSLIDAGSTAGRNAAAGKAASLATTAAAGAARASEAANIANAAALQTPTAAHQGAALAAASTAQSAAAVADTAAADATLAAVTAAAPPALAKPHWWLDVLSDRGGVSFHRFQMAAWTLVLGVIFVHDVYVELAMPTFDSTLLGLLGISSGTYLGLKATSET